MNEPRLFCDICGKKVPQEGETYRLPVYGDVATIEGQPLIMTRDSMRVCKECQECIAALVEGLKFRDEILSGCVKARGKAWIDCRNYSAEDKRRPDEEIFK